ncbi:MAG: 3-deoxy-7-phosphoheptulonate synthase [Deferribacteraceae bacterium]|jgi:3-deoxy-7-phosphoheptulonate synthase|nr:3-deoxy-7-phosphoheptulonate synthase [Deferribacteraceae bacterium]
MSDLKLVGKSDARVKTTFKAGNIEIGKDFLMIAGPCSVENEEQIIQTALKVKEAGANMLRGGAYKPRTSPYDFQGLGRRGLEYLKKASEITGLPFVTEVIDTRDVYLVAEYADMLQIGARNMQNFSLLQEAGRAGKPVMLKNGLFSTINEWMNCAEYIMKEGNEKVLFCERGVRTVETATRNTLDLSILALLKQYSHLPVISDPSHGTGKIYLIEPMSLASVMAGADGLMIEVHISPENALSDGDQSLTPEQYRCVCEKVVKTKQFYDSLQFRGKI